MTNYFVYDLETHNTNRTRPYCISFCRIIKRAGRYERDPTQKELEKSIKDTIAFAGDKCISNALDYCLKLKGDERQNKNKIVENNLQLHAHNGSGFDTWIILNNLDCDKHIVNIIKNGKRIIALKVFNGYIEKKQKTNSSTSSLQMWNDSSQLFFKKTRKNFQTTKRVIENKSGS